MLQSGYSSAKTANFYSVGDSRNPLMVPELSLLNTDGIIEIASSVGHEWNDMLLIHTQEKEHSSHHVPNSFYWLSMPLKKVRLCREGVNCTETAILEPFSLCITLPDTPLKIETSAGETLHIFIRPELLCEVGYEQFGLEPGRVALRSVFGETIASIRWLFEITYEMLREPKELSRLKSDHLVRALSSELLFRFADRRVGHSDVHDMRLSTGLLRRLDEYLEANLHRNVDLDELARICSIGRSSFYYRFKLTKNVSPHQYITGLRIKRAKKRLIEGRETLAELANSCGFSDQAHFTNVFKRVVGKTPLAFRKNLL